MKRIFLLSIFVILLTGCTSIKESSFEEIVNKTINSNVYTINTYRNGYSYYTTRGIKSEKNKSFNEVLEDDYSKYYLYVDIISYQHKTDFSYTENKNAYYSQKLAYNDKKGYIEINNYKNNQYLIEIMYNYAKIEVIVEEEDIKHALAQACTVISSITYNDNVIIKYLANISFEEKEEMFNIFEIVGSDNYLKVTEDKEIEDEINDPDYIN